MKTLRRVLLSCLVGFACLVQAALNPPPRPNILFIAIDGLNDWGVTDLQGRIRFGIAPDKLFQTIQLRGGTNFTLITHALNRDVKYAWRIDAFNASGVAPGTVSPAD